MKKGLKIFSIVILSIISAVAILGAIAFVVIMVIALDADPIIREAYPSPNGDCQIEVVDYWMDDKEYAVYLYVDYPNWLGKYPEPGKEEPEKQLENQKEKPEQNAQRKKSEVMQTRSISPLPTL